MDAQEFFDRLMEAIRVAAARAYLAERSEWYDRTYGSQNDSEGRVYMSGLLALDARDAFAGILPQVFDEMDRHFGQLSPEQSVYLLALRDGYRRLTALPRDLVRERAEVTSAATNAWRVARATNDFKLFAPHLERVLAVVRRQAVQWGGTPGDPDSMYTALVQGYDPGATAQQFQQEIDRILAWLPDFIRSLPVPTWDTAHRPWTKSSQLEICQALASTFGFDPGSGGLDFTEHPFCSSVGPRDVRLTMRYLPQRILQALSATAHETGHGLLEQNKPELLDWGLPYGFVYSLSAHESQSRLWQNHVFGSREFWSFFAPLLRAYHPLEIKFDPELCFRAIHEVRPSLIRVDADEVTYPLHVAIRVKLEMALVSGQLSVADLPGEWNREYERLLGVRPLTDTDGVLQDIHWSSGSFGYFWTYVRGSAGAAQQFAAFSRVEPEWREQFGRGMFSHLLEWLRAEVYPSALTGPFDNTMFLATGEPLDFRCWEEHIRNTYGQPSKEVIQSAHGVIEAPGGEIRSGGGGMTIHGS